MARYLLIALFVALVCVIQANSAPAEATTSSSIPSVEENIKQMLNPENFSKNMESLSKNFNENLETFNKALQNVKFDDVLAKGHEFFEQLIPKSDATKPAASA